MSKRANGEGSVFKRSDGRWTGSLTLPGGKRKSFYAMTRQEVSKKLTTALKAKEDGLPIPGERQTVGQFLEHWLENVARPRVRPSTYKFYSELARLHLIPALGRVPLAKLSPQHVQAMLSQKEKSGLSPRRVGFIRAVLRNALNQAVKWSLLARNVANLTEPPRVPRYEINPLGPDQARQLLEAVKGDRLEALYLVALALGLRQGEALGLRWSDIDLDKGTLVVTVALQRITGEFRLVEPKSRASRRTLYLPQMVVAALRVHRTRQLEDKLRAGGAWQDLWSLVFTDEIGSPLEGTSLTRHFQKLLSRAGLPKMRFHDLRHGAATLLLAQGQPARAIMEILGHSQISLTMNTYAHILPAMKREAAQVMDSLLG